MEVFSKTRFKQAYQMAMSQNVPRSYRIMKANGSLADHLSEMADEAQQMYESTMRHLRENKGMGDEATFIATEIVFADLIQFPEE